MGLETLETLKGKKEVLVNRNHTVIRIIPALILPIVPYLMGVRDIDLIVAIIAMILFGLECGFYLTLPDKCALKFGRHHVWLEHVGRFSCRVELLKHPQIKMVSLIERNECTYVSLEFEQNNQSETFEFAVKDKSEAEEILTNLMTQLPDLSQKLQLTA